MTSDSPQENPYASPEAFGDAYRRGAEAFGQPTDAEAPIFAEGAITEHEYIRSIKLHYRWGWYLARILVLVMVGVYLWFVYTLFRPLIGAVGWRGILLTRAPLLLVAVAAAGLLWTRQDARVRNNWRKAPLRDEPFAVRITPDVVEIRRASYYTLLRWSGFRNYRVYDDLVILASAHAANQLHVFPRRIFTSPDWDRFVKLVSQRLPRA